MKTSLLNKYAQMEKPIKATLWFTISNFLVKGISFIAVPIFAYLMTADEYGLSALFMSYQSILLIASTWELFLGAYQRGIYKYSENIGGFTVSSVFFMNLLTLLCLSVFLIFQGFFVEMTRMPAKTWLVFFAYYFFFPAYNCWMIEKRKAYDYKPVVAATLIYSVISIVIPAVALAVVSPTAETRIVFAFIPAAIYCALFYVKSMKIESIRWALRSIKSVWVYLARYQSPLILHSLAFYVLNQADIIMISYLIGDTETAYYSVAYSVAMAINLFQYSINQSLTPWRYEMMEKSQFSRIEASTTSLLALIGLTILAFILIAPDVIFLLFESSYWSAVWCIPPIALSSYFIFLYSVFVNVETYYEKTRYVMYVSVCCALLNICLNFIGIHYLGFIGCAWATLLSYIVFAIGHYGFMKLTLKQKKIDHRMINPKHTLVLSVVFTIAGMVSLLVYLAPLIRYVFFAILVICAIINRKRIRSILSGIKDIKQ